MLVVSIATKHLASCTQKREKRVDKTELIIVKVEASPTLHNTVKIRCYIEETLDFRQSETMS
jgi:hypothetical protein